MIPNVSPSRLSRQRLATIGFTLYGVASPLALASQTTSPAANDAKIAAGLIDTSIERGRTNFDHYQTSGACLQAAEAARVMMTRRWPDTTAYAPERDSVPSAIVAMGRTCGARFTVENVPQADWLDLVHLALLTNDDAKARSIADRYVASFPDSARRAWALFNLDTTYLFARPMRLDAAESVVATLDALGDGVALQRQVAHQYVLDVVQRTFDIPRLEREARAVLALAAKVTARDRTDRDAPPVGNALLELFALELYRSSNNALIRTAELVKPTGYQIDQAKVTGLMQFMHFDWMLSHIGQPIPQLHPDFWIAADGTQHVWPVPGKVSIFVHPDPQWGPKEAAMWKRLADKYGASLDITFVCATRGFFHNGPPLTPAAEAERLGTYFQTELQLPVSVAVDSSTFRRLADGRRLPVEPGFQRDPYYHWPFGMVDPAGKVVILLLAAPNERRLDAWIAQSLGRSPAAPAGGANPPRTKGTNE